MSKWKSNHVRLVVSVCLITSVNWIIAGCAGIRSSVSAGDPQAAASPSPSPAPSPSSSSGYLTWKNDNARTGLQPNETQLTPANVNAVQFGMKFANPVDGWIYAQPLYVANLTVGGAQHNVVFVATEHDSVYAFDADAAGPPLWHRSFLGPGITTVPTAGNNLIPVQPEVGITSTPVIDAASGTLYVLAQTVENGVNFPSKLHALDITSGEEKAGSPAVLSDPVFDGEQEFERSALLLANGNVYVAFASYGDILPYHGFIFAFNASTLAKVAVWNVTSSGGEGGIWMGGAGPSADQNGNIYVSVSNGTWDGVTNFGDSLVKLDPALHVLDFFTPFNEAALSAGDEDLGSGGVLLVPDQSGAFPHEIVACGKPDPIYVVNRDRMGHKGSLDDSQIIQSVQNQLGGTSGLQAEDHCFTTAAFFQQKLYFIGNNDVIKAFALDPASGKLSATPTSQGSFTFVFPGGQAVVSSNGATNGIVWAVDFNVASSLHAFDAADVSRELYRSPSIGQASKWAVPTVINGKVYIPTKTRLVVFGLN
ncbi:MAG: pyrrolo-quinoline quinone [Candidatus Angelobacter sp.]